MPQLLRSRALLALLAVTAMVTGTLTVAALRPGAADAAGPPGSYIVVLRDDAAPPVEAGAKARRTANAAGATPKHTYTHALKGFAAVLSSAQLATVRANPEVAYVEPDVVRHVASQTTPTGVRRIFGPDNPKLGIGTATDRRVDVDIAIIDTGVNDHLDLDVVDRVTCMDGEHCVPGGFDRDGHGTHVAGIAAAINDGNGVVGVAPGARIWSLQVCIEGNWCNTSAILAAMDHVTRHADQIEVANISIGSAGTSQSWTEAIRRGVDAGVTFVVSAGNQGADAAGFTPANIPDAITVSNLSDSDGRSGGLGGPNACDPAGDDRLANSSNWGSTVDIAAPGCVSSTSRTGDYETRGGTSMASPHVAGAVAVLASGTNKPSSRADVMALRSRLLAAGNKNWTHVARSADDPQEPLLDVHDSAVFAPTLVADTTGAWRPKPSMPGGVTRFASAQCVTEPGILYTLGGVDARSAVVASTWRYDLGGHTWTARAPYPGGSSQWLTATCADKGRIHVVGGTAGAANHWIYDTKANVWESAPAVPRGVFQPAMGAWNGKVVVIGGRSTSSGPPVKEVNTFDIATRTWQTSPAPVAMAEMGFAQSGRDLYLVGGYGSASPQVNLDAVFRVDLEMLAWSPGPKLPLGRYGLSLVATDKALYALGGNIYTNARQSTTDMLRLNLATWSSAGSWTTSDPLPVAVGSAGASCTSAGINASVTSLGGVTMTSSSQVRRAELWATTAYQETCALGDTGRWQAGPAGVGGDIDFATAQCANDPDGLYKLGGQPGTATVNRVYRYRAGSGTWQSKPSYPGTWRFGMSAVCTADGKIHTFGGAFGDVISADHYVYDTVTNRWTSAAPLPRAVAYAAVGVWGTKVAVAGGDASPYSGLLINDVQVYDTAAATWSAGPAMPTVTTSVSWAQRGSMLYVVGGWNHQQAVQATTQRLNLATMTWAKGPALATARRYATVLATDKALYVIGGVDQQGDALASVERLGATGGWTAFDALPFTQTQAAGWCAPAGSGNAQLGVTLGRTGPRWSQHELGQTWRTTIPGETCAKPV